MRNSREVAERERERQGQRGEKEVEEVISRREKKK